MSDYGDSDDEDSDDGSLFDDDDDDLSDDGVEALKRERRSYRTGAYRSRGIVSKEWIAARDAMRRGDDSAFAKMHMMLKRGQRSEVVRGTWGGANLLHHGKVTPNPKISMWSRL